MTHGWDPSNQYPGWVDGIRNEIRDALGPDTDWHVRSQIWTQGHANATVFGASTSVMPDVALSNAVQEGNWLGKELWSQGWQEIHLIGHSAGAGLIQSAIDTIKALDATNKVKIHATFLDPFNGTSGLFRNVYGRGADWADNYFAWDSTDVDSVGRTGGKLPYAHNVDVTWLDPSKTEIEVQPGVFMALSSHEWPHEWYRSTIGVCSEYGLYLSREAGGWSNTALHAINNDPVRLGAPPLSGTIGGIPVRWDPFRTFDVAKSAWSSLVQIKEGIITMPTASPAWISSVIETNEPVNLVHFTLDFTSQSGAEGLFSIYWEDVLLGTIDERFVPDGPQEYTFGLPSTFEAGNYVLGFRLDPFTETQSIASIGQVATGYAVPEPSMFVLLLISMVLSSPLWRVYKKL